MPSQFIESSETVDAANSKRAYDAVLIVSFGGPDEPDDVLPFLENVLRGRNVPRERMQEVAEHYYHFGGRSPINEQNRALIAALERELAEYGPHLPVYWGNRNWHPLLPDTLRQMATGGVRRALAFFTSPFSSYSSCRQYRENIAAAQAEVAAGGSPAIGRQAGRLSPPQIDKLRAYFNHPGYIEPMIERTREALQKVPDQRRSEAALLFTAHSIPQSMADTSRYVEQLREASRLVAENVGWAPPTKTTVTQQQSVGGAHPSPTSWQLVYQSRSGPPQQHWLEPDVGDWIRARHADSPLRDVVIVPIGFISDHMEVLYDLDTEVRALCGELGINMVRAATVGTHPRFVRMIRELIEERMTDKPTRLALGQLGPSHDVCPKDCCLYDPRSR